MSGGGSSPNESLPYLVTSPRKPVSSPLDLSRSTSSQKERGPIRQPRRQKPLRTMGISGGRVEREKSQVLGMKKRDLLLLRWRQTERAL